MALTPMMQQYFEIKNKYKDCLLFYRLGDFYEMFFEDALTTSRELEITLTGRDCGQEERAPMCGVPYHAAESYISKLIEKGYKVAICEQVEDPKTAKGIVKREVIRIVTPGTVIQGNSLDETKNNYLACGYLYYKDKEKQEMEIGLSIVDVTTGEFKVTEIKGNNVLNEVLDELAKYYPSEMILNEDMIQNKYFTDGIKQRFNSYIQAYEFWNFEYEVAYKKLCDHFKLHSLDGFGLKEFKEGICSAGALIRYLNDTQKIDLKHIIELTPYLTNEYMTIDISSRRNLELTETMREKSKKGSLLWVLDKTKTSMGARLLRKWVEQPLLSKIEIQKRLNSVEELKEDLLLREELKEILKTVYDIERLLGKLVYNTANARDLIALKNSIKNIPNIKEKLYNCKSSYLIEIEKNLDCLEDIYILIENAICEEPPIAITEGDIIKENYNESLYTLKLAKKEGKQWIANLENEEKQKTGIKNLKISYNKIFGYYIEITKSNVGNAPDRYIRKQTLANCERYITEELKKIEDTVLGAEEKMVKLEYEIFISIKNEIIQHLERIQKIAKQIAIIDVLQSLSEVAEKQNYCKPTITDKDVVNIQQGRHPVVEKMMQLESFISNDTYLDEQENQVVIITGPNMAGKSTYMRQVALIVLLAQIGSFVPAETAEIGITDRIFTRVGASDDLASGQSTFMVEMSEVANILHNATNKSLLILDEIGRGTSTFDGLSIAWAVVEYISDKQKIGAKTLFATHYHELTELEDKIKGIKNYCISVKEEGDTIIFLRKIIRGGADNSYGVQVAKLAGLPEVVINRAKQLLEQLENADIAKNTEKVLKNEERNVSEKKLEKNNNQVEQLNLFNTKESEIIKQLKEVDVLNLTPMQAMQILFEMVKQAK